MPTWARNSFSMARPGFSGDLIRRAKGIIKSSVSVRVDAMLYSHRELRITETDTFGPWSPIAQSWTYIVREVFLRLPKCTTAV